MIILAGDIGGTSTRLMLVESKGDHIKERLEQHFPSGKYASLFDIVDEFLSDQPIAAQDIEAFCFAVAGPIRKGKVKFTNLPWMISIKELHQHFSTDHIALINDFEAIGYGIEALTDDDLLTIQPGTPVAKAPKALIGAGTGLGIAIMHHGLYRYWVMATEGGHIDFAPTDEEQFSLLEHMKHKYHRVSLERVLSGQGLVNIYYYVRDTPLFNQKENKELRQLLFNHKGQSAPFIADYALNKHDSMAQRALDIFIRIYGSASGNLALTTLPYGGLYLVGGIAPKLAGALQDNRFTSCFRDKGRMSGLLENVPVHLVLNTKVGLYGAAVFAKHIPNQNA